MSPPSGVPAKFRETRGLASVLRERAVPARLKTRTVSGSSHTNHTGLGSGLPAGPTVVSHTTRSSRRWRAARAPNSELSSIIGASYGRVVLRSLTPSGRHATVRRFRVAGAGGKRMRCAVRRVMAAVLAWGTCATTAVAAVVLLLLPAGAAAAQFDARHSLRPPLTAENFYFVMTDRFDNGSPANDLGGLPADRLQSG